MDEQETAGKKGGLLASTLVVSSMTLLSRVLGLVRDVVLARLLGASAVGAASLSAAASGEKLNGSSRVGSAHGAGAALDMSKLGIQKGKTCWVLRCDCLVLSADGSALQDMIIKIRRRATSMAGARHSALYVLDHDNNEIWALANSGMQMCWPVGTGLIGRAALHGQPEAVPRARGR